MVHRDADGGGELRRDLGRLQFSEREALPNLTLALCCCVWHLTKGRSLSAGRGAFAAAFAARFNLRDFFLPGWLNQDLMWSGPRLDVCHFLWKCWLGMILLCLTMVALRCSSDLSFVVAAAAYAAARCFP